MTAAPASVFDAQRRALSVGILLGVTLSAFEGLAIVTVAPEIATDLGGLSLYGWIFSGYLLASLFSTVIGGSGADRRGPAAVLLLALASFVAGSLVAGFAPSMPWLVAGRIVQGLGGGGLITALYAVVTLAYPDALRPRMLAYMSTAWVLPALVGPSAAGALAEFASWRWVFWGIVPLAALTALLTARAFGRVPRPSGAEAPTARRWPGALALAAATGAMLAALGAAEAQSVWAAAAIPAAAVAVVFLRRLVPAGTLTLARGLPAAVAARGLLFAGFIGVEAFLALALVRVHGVAPTWVGAVIAVGAISWTSGSWLQDRLERGPWRRSLRVLLGAGILCIGLALQLVAVLVPAGGLVVSVLGWSLAGAGMGSAHSAATALAFAAAPEGREGRVASALQLADQVAAAVATGLGGTLLALGRAADGPFAALVGADRVGVQSGVALALAAGLAFALVGAVAAARLSGGPEGPRPAPR